MDTTDIAPVTDRPARAKRPLNALQWFLMGSFLITLAIGLRASHESQAQAIGICVYIFLGLLTYFLPWFVAQARRHHNTLAIFMLDLFLGWTFLGWVIALVWASTRPERSK
jgi:uncharacterized membrane protein YhaH (DUF805 family)